MKATIVKRVAALAALAGAGSLQAHHSGSMYDPTPVWVQGTVVSFESIDPHTVTTLETRGADGQLRFWGIEGPGDFQLVRLELDTEVPEVGEVIDVCGFPYRSVEELSRMFPGGDFLSLRHVVGTDDPPTQYLWGHLIVTEDGEKRLWNPHGLLSECIRSSDEPVEAWLGFVNSSPNVRQAWCTQRGYTNVQSNASRRDYVEEINASLDEPCE